MIHIYLLRKMMSSLLLLFRQLITTVFIFCVGGQVQLQANVDKLATRNFYMQEIRPETISERLWSSLVDISAWTCKNVQNTLITKKNKVKLLNTVLFRSLVTNLYLEFNWNTAMMGEQVVKYACFCMVIKLQWQRFANYYLFAFPWFY